MAKDIDLEQVMALAIRGEEDAKDYYLSVAREVGNELAKAKFEALAKEEDSHRMMLLYMYKRLSGRDSVPTVKGSPKTHEEHSFVPRPNTMEGIVELALERERQAQRFYKDLAAKVDDDKVRRVLEYLADIERGHEVSLEAELNALRRDADWYAKGI